MSRKRIKQYLMLLLAIGVIAVVASGSGTFASFNAETQNNNNTFATGTLLLHSTTGGTTCASESNSGNLNVTDPTGCSVLFSNVSIGSPAKGTLHTGNDVASGSPITSIVVDLTGNSAIEPGDQIQLDNGTNQEVFTAAQELLPGNFTNATLHVLSQTPAHAYPAATSTVSVKTYTQYAQIALKNAGTLDAQDIKFQFPGSPGCTNSASSVLAVGTTNAAINNGGTSVTLASPAAFGAPNTGTITIGGNNLTLTQQLNPGDSTIHFSAWGGSTISSGAAVTFTPFVVGSGTLCSALKYAIVQTDASFNHFWNAAAQTCASGDSSVSGVASIGCDFVGSAPTVGTPNNTTFNTLNISNATTGAGTTNNANELDNGNTRYFLVGIQTDVSGLTNAAQNQQATFAMRWHIDQK